MPNINQTVQNQHLVKHPYSSSLDALINLEETPLFFVLNCKYFWGGDMQVPVLLKTNVNLSSLLANDVSSYITLVEQKMVKLLNFGTFSGEAEITHVECFNKEELANGQSFQSLLHEVINKEGSSYIGHLNQSLSIDINRELPSAFNGFRQITEDTYNAMLEFTENHEVILGGGENETS